MLVFHSNVVAVAVDIFDVDAAAAAAAAGSECTAAAADRAHSHCNSRFPAMHRADADVERGSYDDYCCYYYSCIK